MDDWNSQERALLNALQREDSPTVSDQARVRERVILAAGVLTAAGAATTAAAAATTAGGGASAASAVSATGKSVLAGLGLWKSVLVVGSIVGVGSGALIAASAGEVLAPRPAAPAPIHPPATAPSSQGSGERANVEKPTAEKSTPEAQAESPEDGEIARPDAASTRTTLPSERRQVPSTVAPRENTLKEEALLLSQAQAALQKGDPQAAIAALAKHGREYPHGVLSGEREAALSVAYCKSGDLTQGKARAQRFIARSPSSPMVQRLRAACKLPAE